jgi:ABC-type nitrate/sulfonate/bicarbonate transport system substrate-binding protein
MQRFLGAATVAAAVVLSSFAMAQDGSKGTIRLGLEIPASIVNVPMLIALDRMKAEGYDVETVEFQSPETLALAMQNGEVDLVGTSAGTAFSAIDAGFAGKAFLGMAVSDFLMVATKDLTTCESLDGKNVAVQSREGTTGVLVTRWLAATCPDARPNILIVPGSENRVAGLIAGQLDAAPIDSQNTAQLMALRPGDFTTIESFGESAKLLASVYYAPDSWLADQADTVKALTATYVDVIHEAQADPAEMLARTQALLADTDPALVEKVLDGWLERGVFVPVWGMQPDTIAAALEFYGSARPYASIKDPADVSTDTFVAGLSDK